MAVQTSGASPCPRIDTDLLRMEHPIADVVAQYGIDLRRSGSALVGRCPFHADGGRPNLTLFPRTGRFMCFRCQARGDVIGFIQRIERLSFREAVKRLGTWPQEHRQTAEHPQRRSVRSQRLRPTQRPEDLDVLSAAIELYRNRLLVDGEALQYLSTRGIARETIEQAQLGFAVGHELIPYLSWRRFPIESARRCGLINSDGKERLAGRLVVPEIRDGKATWMVGRLLDPSDEEPKYLGLYGRKPLLGWEFASRDLRGVCLVEGPFDMLTLRQWGLPALALCGTGQSAESLRALERWQRIYTVFDADVAGREATTRLMEALGSRVIPVDLPPDVKDPSDLASRADGEDLFRAAIRDAVERIQLRA